MAIFTSTVSPGHGNTKFVKQFKGTFVTLGFVMTATTVI